MDQFKGLYVLPELESEKTSAFDLDILTPQRVKRY